MAISKLSIIIPAYNEERFLPLLLERIIDVKFDWIIDIEIILVDDASTDGTAELGRNFQEKGIIYHRQQVNSGKGAAVRCGIELASGDYILIQDADLEYFPEDIPVLLNSGVSNKGAAIYGSRVKGASSLGGIRRILRFWPGQAVSSYVFNMVLSIFLLSLRKVWISDTLTGYKLYPASIFDNWMPTTSGFETDHEITSRILNVNGKIVEVGINYSPRRINDGKKIRAKDGLIAIRTFWRHRK